MSSSTVDFQKITTIKIKLKIDLGHIRSNMIHRWEHGPISTDSANKAKNNCPSSKNY